MSEKRILCTKVSGNCRHLRVVDSLSLANLFALNEVGTYCSASGWKKINNDQCKSCNKAEYVGITREQAIETMAKALLSFMWPRNYLWVLLDEDDKKYFRKAAEVSLNALLEGHNDKR